MLHNLFVVAMCAKATCHIGPRLVIWENVIVADINETHEIFTYNLSLTEFNLQNEDK